MVTEKRHRADEITRPMKLGPWTLVIGTIVTALMFGLLALGVGRDRDPAFAFFEPASPEEADSFGGLARDRERERFPGYEPMEWWSLVIVDRRGNVREAVDEKRDFRTPRFSPDGRRVSVDFTGADGRDIWIVSPGGGRRWRATFDRDGQDASWSPGGRRIAYTSMRNGRVGIYEKTVFAGLKGDSLVTDSSLARTGIWIPDRSALITVASSRSSALDIVTVTGNGRGPLEPVVSDPASEHSPALSPDGNWLAYVSNRSGVDEVYVRRFPRSIEDVRVSVGGGREPVWNPSGGEIFYRGIAARRGAFIAARVRAGNVFEVVSREPLFPARPFIAGDNAANYDVSPDGRVFVMVAGVNPERAADGR